MTNQEVAKSLKNIRDLYPWGEDSYKTLDYAIRAVVELPKRRKEAKRWRAKAHQIAGESYENGYLAGQKNVAERCEDAISRQAVLETLDDMDNALDEDRTVENYKELLKECYEVLPSVNPQEPKTGYWMIVHRKGIYTHLVCDKCLSNAPYDCRTNYCPNCGAKMVEPQERSDKG